MPMLREEIRQIVHASVQETLGHLGFTVDDPHAIQQDMIHLRRARLGQEELTKGVRRTAVGVGVTALIYMLWDGLRQLLMER
ncbi:MAG: hypothetical protein DI582_07195 [Azospirillum brasilense]|nr:MAG: hypothetical protein DI582_07195 [Azospirillum brasilense]